MTASRVTYANILSEAWNNLYQLISSSSNVNDPSVGSGEFRKWVYTRPPDTTATNFAGYPYIVIPPVDVDTNAGRKSVDGNRRMIGWGCDIEVVTCDREWNNRDGKGATDNDAISEDVIQTLNSLTNRNTMATNGLKDVGVNASSMLIESEEGVLVYRRIIMVRFDTRMAVSA